MNTTPSTPCPAPETLAGFLDNRLTEADRNGIERHLASCSACFELVMTSARALAGSPSDRVSPDAPTLAMPSSPDGVTRTAPLVAAASPVPRRWILGSAAAASALGLAALGYWIASPGQSSPAYEAPLLKDSSVVKSAQNPAQAPAPPRIGEPQVPAVLSASDTPAPQFIDEPIRRAPETDTRVAAPPPRTTPAPSFEAPEKIVFEGRPEPPRPEPVLVLALTDAPADPEEMPTPGRPVDRPDPLDAANADPVPASDSPVVHGRLSILQGSPPRLQTRPQASSTAVKAQTDLLVGNLLKVTSGFAGIEIDGGFLTVNGGGGGSTLRVQPSPDAPPWMLDRGMIYVEADPETDTIRISTPHGTVAIQPGEVQINVSGTQTQIRVEAGEANLSSAQGAPVTLGTGDVGISSATQGPRLAARNAQNRVPDWVMVARNRRLRDIVLAVLPKNLTSVERDRILQSLQRVLQRGYPVSDLADLITRASRAENITGRDLVEIAHGMALAVDRKRNATPMRERLLALLEEGVRGRDMEESIQNLLNGLPELLDSILHPGAHGGPDGALRIPGDTTRVPR